MIIFLIIFYFVGDVGLFYLVYLIYEGILISICIYCLVLQFYDIDQIFIQRCWGWFYLCCCCYFNRIMKLFYVKGIFKCFFEVYRSLYDCMLCGGGKGVGVRMWRVIGYQVFILKLLDFFVNVVDLQFYSILLYVYKLFKNFYFIWILVIIL